MWPFSNTPKIEEPSGPAMTLADFVRGFTHAFNAMHKIAEDYWEHMIENQFNADRTPKVREYVLPGGKAKVVLCEVSTLPGDGLLPEELEIHCALKVHSTTLKDASLDPTKDMTRASFNVGLAPISGKSHDEATVMDLRMKFKAQKPPEGILTLKEHFDKTVRVVPVEAPEPQKE
jgi:hypothetical protein